MEPSAHWELFLKYDYPETKDLCKYFLTLVTTILVISLTFSEKILTFNSALLSTKWLLITCWLLLLLALIFCGLGLLLVTIAAGGAAYQHSVNANTVRWSYLSIVLAGILLVLGLFLLIMVVIQGTVFASSVKNS